MNAWEHDWVYGITTVNAVRQVSGLTNPTFKISVYASYHDVHLSRAQYQAGVEVQGGVLSRGLGLAAALARWFPITTPYAKMLELGSAAAYKFGFSRAVEPVVSSVRAKKYGALGYMTGEASYAEVLGSDPTMTRDMTYRFLPGMEEDSVLAIARKWSMLGASVPVDTPVIMNPAVYGFADTLNESISLGHMGQMALMFERWTGTIDVKVQVVGSPLVRWRIGVVVIQPGVNIPVTFPTDGSYETHIIEVAGTTEYEFTAPIS